MAKTIVVDIDVNSNKGVEEVKKLNKELNKTNEELGGATEALDSFSGGAVTKIKGFKGAIGGLTKGFKSLRLAIISTGIGALIIAITAVAQAFRSTEEGQNQFAKLMSTLGVITSVFTDRLAALGRGLIDLFTNPIETLKNFGKSIKEFIMDRIDLAVESLGVMGSAISKLFKGDFSGALDDAKDGFIGLNKALNPTVIVVDALTKSTKELVQELKEEAKIAGEIADQRAKADKLDRELIVARAEANRDRAALLEQAVNKEKFTLQERIGFLTEAGKLEEDITNKEINAAKLRLDAKIRENALGDSTKEDLEEEARLKAELINLETAKLTKQKEVTSQLIALKAEEVARLKAIEDEEKQRKKEEEELKAEEEAAKKIKEDEAEKERLRKKQEAADRELEIEKTLEESKQNIRMMAIDNVAKGFALLGQMAGKNKALQAASIIGENAVGIAKQVISTRAANAAVTAKYALLPGGEILAKREKLMNNISLGLGITSSVASTAKALSALKAGGSAGSSSSQGGSVPTEASSPAAFNVVGASATNQLADAIGGQLQQPIQAYVVSNDVTTAQSMDRNIVNDAGL